MTKIFVNSKKSRMFVLSIKTNNNMKNIQQLPGLMVATAIESLVGQKITHVSKTPDITHGFKKSADDWAEAIIAFGFEGKGFSIGQEVTFWFGDNSYMHIKF